MFFFFNSKEVNAILLFFWGNTEKVRKVTGSELKVCDFSYDRWFPSRSV